MRITQATDNGNVTFNREATQEAFNENRGWRPSSLATATSYGNRINYSRFNPNCNAIYSSTETRETLVNYTSATETGATQLNVEVVVCNRQYRINAQNNINCTDSCNTVNNLEFTNDTALAYSENYIDESNAYSEDTPIDSYQLFDHSDTDEMSEKGVHPVPRGIVNPNYPGFQHLAHTLQDYSSNIENFYQSENDMTDDDVDIEITELAYEPVNIQNTSSTELKNIKNNNISKEKIPPLQKDLKLNTLDSHIHNEIPDLLKTIPTNNNNNEIDTFSYDMNCSDADIENNFNTKDIIGDFNKEVEDEIKQLLNYNINIQDDLEELRKDIKDTFAKPIQNTINNISDVVNHVIKKLVETQGEINEDTDVRYQNPSVNVDITDIHKENEKNAKTEMNLSRPTFLFIDNNINNKIDDAILSDGKDEINISEYDPDKLSQNVENTIKQLSTELRKIIPKLDEMRERDRIWAECKKEEKISTLKDGNSNEIGNSSSSYNFMNSVNTQLTAEVSRNYRYNDNHTSVNTTAAKSPTESRASRDRQKDVKTTKKCYRSAHNNTSVRKNDSTNDNDLGSFDVYNIETALPKLDIDAIENHLRAAKEAERRKRNDREEIRRRLAMGAETEEYYSLGHTDRPGKKPSLHSRLQSGMNLQICFMNETASDNESQASDLDHNINYSTKSLSRSSLFSKSSYNSNHPYQTRPLSVNITKHDKISTIQSGAKLRPSSLTVKTTKSRSTHSLGHIELKESDFYALQATLQTEARIALAQAKEMARIQMERERRGRPVSPVTEMLRRSMQKASAPLARDRRRVSRQLLTDMNIAQLQVIVNELHSQIESLNDTLVKLLMARDELHMGQDSMLVDIEDLTRYLGVKEQTKKTKGAVKTGMKRLTSLVHK